MIYFLTMIHFLLICFCFPVFSPQAEELPIAAPFMPEAYVAKKAIAELKEKKKKKASGSKNNSRARKTAQGQKNTIETEEDYSPSLTESLNDSSHLKNEIKRQLSADDTTQTDPEENSSEEEVANFGNFSISISERKKEENLKKVKKKN